MYVGRCVCGCVCMPSFDYCSPHSLACVRYDTEKYELACDLSVISHVRRDTLIVH